MNGLSWVKPLPEGDHRFDRGLWLRVRDKNASWVFRFTAPNGRRREMGLGVFAGHAETSEAEVAAAKAAATAARLQLMDGIDPLDARDAARKEKKLQQARAKKLTVQRAMWRWVDYESSRRDWNKKDLHCVMRSVDSHPPRWFRDLPVFDLSPEHVVSALNEMDCSSDSKARFRRQVSRFCEWMVRCGKFGVEAEGVTRIACGAFVSIAAAIEASDKPVEAKREHRRVVRLIKEMKDESEQEGEEHGRHHGRHERSL